MPYKIRRTQLAVAVAVFCTSISNHAVKEVNWSSEVLISYFLIDFSHNLILQIYLYISYTKRNEMLKSMIICISRMLYKM